MTRLEQALETLREATFTDQYGHVSVGYSDAIRILTEWWPKDTGDTQESAPAPVETLKDATVSYPAEMQGPGKWFPLVCPKCEWRGLSRDSICTPTGGDDYNDPECPRCRAVLEDDPKAAPAREVPPVSDEREREIREWIRRVEMRPDGSLSRRETACRDLLSLLDTARAERDTLHKQTETTYCAYCGHATQIADKDEAGRQITEHIRTCPKHPMRAVEAELARLRGENATARADAVEQRLRADALSLLTGSRSGLHPCRLVTSDFAEDTITIKVPIAVGGKRLHYHPCAPLVDLSEFLDDHAPAAETQAPKENET